MAPFTLRRLSPDDAEAFRELRLEALRLCPAAFGSDYEDERVQPIGWFQARLTDHAVFGAILNDATLEGVAGLMVPAAAKMRHKGVLWGMYVRPGSRGTGMAAALINAAVDYAHGVVEEVKLEVSPDNVAAIRLYTAAGFVVYAREPRAMKIGDAFLDSLLMRRPFRR